jgi:hypothetical protein
VASEGENRRVASEGEIIGVASVVCKIRSVASVFEGENRGLCGNRGVASVWEQRCGICVGKQRCGV